MHKSLNEMQPSATVGLILNMKGYHLTHGQHIQGITLLCSKLQTLNCTSCKEERMCSQQFGSNVVNVKASLDYLHKSYHDITVQWQSLIGRSTFLLVCGARVTKLSKIISELYKWKLLGSRWHFCHFYKGTPSSDITTVPPSFSASVERSLISS